MAGKKLHPVLEWSDVVIVEIPSVRNWLAIYRYADALTVVKEPLERGKPAIHPSLKDDLESKLREWMWFVKCTLYRPVHPSPITVWVGKVSDSKMQSRNIFTGPIHMQALAHHTRLY